MILDMTPDFLGTEVGGYATFQNAGLERLDQLNLGSEELKLFALGRHCLEAVCRAYRPSSLLLPIFTCSSLKQVAKDLGVPTKYYNISESFVPLLESVHEEELLVVNNYFGLSASSGKLEEWLKKTAPSRCLIDDTHSLGCANQFPGQLSFISPRKFIAVTDGGILFDPKRIITTEIMPKKQDVSWSRVGWLFRAIDEMGRNESYKAYRKYREDLQILEYSSSSETTRYLLSVYDIKKVIRDRNKNFQKLRTEMPLYPAFNDWVSAPGFSPIGYPLFVKNAQRAQDILSESKVYAARYWPDLDLNDTTNGFEKELLEHLLIVPISTSLTESQLSSLKRLADWCVL